MSNNELIRERARAILRLIAEQESRLHIDRSNLYNAIQDIRLHALHIKRLAGKIHPAKPGLDAPQRAG